MEGIFKFLAQKYFTLEFLTQSLNFVLKLKLNFASALHLFVTRILTYLTTFFSSLFFYHITLTLEQIFSFEKLLRTFLSLLLWQVLL